MAEGWNAAEDACDSMISDNKRLMLYEFGLNSWTSCSVASRQDTANQYIGCKSLGRFRQLLIRGPHQLHLAAFSMATEQVWNETQESGALGIIGDANNEASSLGNVADEHSLKPYFVIVQDNRTGEFHHPYIRYLFSDDDPELFTDAIRAQLDRLDPAIASAGTPSTTHSKNERLIVIDVADNGQEVRNAQSLSGEWHVSQTNVCTAPTFEEGSDDTEAGLMMTIAGQDCLSYNLDSQRESLGSFSEDADPESRLKKLSARVEELASIYGEQMNTLRNLTDAGPCLSS